MKITGYNLACHIWILKEKFNFQTIEEMCNWLEEYAKDTFEFNEL